MLQTLDALFDGETLIPETPLKVYYLKLKQPENHFCKLPNL